MRVFVSLWFVLPVSSAFILPLTDSRGKLDVVSVISHLNVLEKTVTDLHQARKSADSEIAILKSRIIVLEKETAKAKNDTNFLKNEMSELKTSLPKNVLCVTGNTTLQRVNVTDATCPNESLSMKKRHKIDQLISDYDALKHGFIECGEKLSLRNSSIRYSKTNFCRDSFELNRISQTLDVMSRKVNEIETTIPTVQNAVEKIRTNVLNITSALQVLSKHYDLTIGNGTFSSEVVFEARISDFYLELKSGNMLKFEVAEINIGEGFDNHSGSFHAPVSGIYFFWVQVTKTDGPWCRVNLSKSGVYAAKSSTPVAGDQTVTLVAAMDVAAGEDVAVWVDGATKIYGQIYTQFGGTLLAKLPDL